MAKDTISKIRFWRPASPLFSWMAIAILLIFSLAPFWIGVLSSLQLGLDSQTQIDWQLVWNAIKFTYIQAGISTIFILTLSPILGVALVFSPAKYYKLATILRTLVFCLPSVVIATGLVLCWGKNGIGTRFLEIINWQFLPNGWLYSKYSVVLANVFMNLPFASLMIARSIDSIKPEQIVSIRILGLSSSKVIKVLIWPTIRPQLYYLAGLTFLLSMGNFGALSVFSGSSATFTLEMGIYQALFLNADWNMAAIFSILHTSSAAIVALIFLIPQYLSAQQSASEQSFVKTKQTIKSILDSSSVLHFFLFFLSLLFDLLFFAPILSTGYDAISDFSRIFSGESGLYNSVATSLQRSLSYAIPVGFLACIMSWLVVRACVHYNMIKLKWLSTSILLAVFSVNVIPGMASAFGFMTANSWLPGLKLDFWPIIFLHTCFVLPFITSFLIQTSLKDINSSLSLMYLNGISKSKWIYSVEWPLLRKTFGIMFVIAVSLSLNETSVVSMLGEPENPALTTTMINLMGHYRFDDSAVVSLCLIIFTSIALFTYSQAEKKNNGFD